MLSWQLVFALLGLTLVGWAMVAPSPRRIQVVLAMSISPTVALIWSQALFHPAVTASGQAVVDFPFPWTISWFGTDGVSLPGLRYGIEQAGRTLVTISASLLLVLTTSPSDIIWAFRRFRMPVKAGFALTVALRFLPDLIGRLSTLLKAVQARGLDLNRPGWLEWRAWPAYLRRVIASIPIVTVPLLIGALRGTGTMAMVADARAFGSTPRPTTLHAHTRTRADLVAATTLGLLILTVGVLMALHLGGRTLSP
jgi:energy-coupling factor transport system permease protein